MLAERKRFRIEGPESAVRPVAKAVSALPPIVADQAPAPLSPVSAAADAAIQTELAAMRGAIAAMRRDVARMQQSDADHAGMRRAACELDAVSEATERATTTILGAVEEIESAATMLRAAELEPGRDDYVATILERVVLLYEACNFQDVTGQRIAMVVKTIKFVEERLETIAQNGRPLDPVVPSSEPELRGPALATDEQASQSDIDSYFG